MATVALEKIKKSFGTTVVLEELSLAIEDQEFLVLVGPSGCGKSTALRLIAGLEDPTGGTIAIDGRVVNDVAPKDRDIAMVFQNYALYPHMTVFDNMAFGLKMRKVRKAEIRQKVADVAEMLELSDLLKRYPRQLSGGQRQRVALGRAIVRNPKVFLMDEPLSNLDAKLRVHMRTEIARLHQRMKATTIYVTHDQVEAMTMGSRVVVLNEGVIQQVGTPMTVYQEPTNLFVAGFIGQMNFFRGRVEAGSPALVFGTGDAIQRLSLPGEWSGRLSVHEGREVVLGVRPEHWGLEHGEPEHGGVEGRDLTSHSHISVAVVPDRLEQLGSEQLVHFQFAGENAMAKLPPDVSIPVGEPLRLHVAMDQASLFDGATEKRLDF